MWLACKHVLFKWIRHHFLDHHRCSIHRPTEPAAPLRGLQFHALRGHGRQKLSACDIFSQILEVCVDLTQNQVTVISIMFVILYDLGKARALGIASDLLRS